MIFVTVLLLLVSMGVAANDVGNDRMSNRSYSTINTTLLAGFAGSIGALVIALVIVRALGKKIRGPVVIITSLWVTVVASTITAWSVVYQTTRDTIEDQASQLLVAAAESITTKIQSDIDVAVRLLELIQSNEQTNLLSVEDGYPVVQRYLHSIYTTISRAAPSIELLFCGTPAGEIQGFGSNQLGKKHVIIGLASDELIPFCNNASTDLFEIATPPVCTKRNESSYLIFNSTGDIDINNIAEGELIAHKNFDATKRPWWTSRNISWTEPYPYEMGGIGITVSKANYKNGIQIGTFGIDFSWTSFKVLMIPPTKNGDVMLTIPKDGEEVLLTTSIPDAELHALCNANISGASTITVMSCNKRVSGPYKILLKQVESLQSLKSGKYIFSDDGRDIILTYPLTLVGGLRLTIVITVPYNDVMGDAEAAYTTTLLIGVVTSFVFGGFIYVGVSITLIPLKHLALDMDEVAWLHLDDIGERSPSLVYEISWMQESFSKMVSNLVEYRAYLPQSVMMDTIDSDDVDAEPATATGKSSASLTSVETIDFRVRINSAGGLESQIRLLRRSVSLAACNIRNFNSFTRKYEIDELSSIHTNYLSRVVDAAGEHLGIIDSFNGDRVTLSFNAVRQCQDHRKSVARCAVNMSQVFGEIKLDVNIGCAGGEGICGPLGCTEIKKNCVVGTVSTNVYCIERYGCHNKIRILCDHLTATSTIGCADTRKAAFVKFPNSRRAVTIHEIHGLQTTTEWMFDAAMPPIFKKYYHYNLAFDLMWEGNATEAIESLSLSDLKPYDDILREQIENSRERVLTVVELY